MVRASNDRGVTCVPGYVSLEPAGMGAGAVHDDARPTPSIAAANDITVNLLIALCRHWILVKQLRISKGPQYPSRCRVRSSFSRF